MNNNSEEGYDADFVGDIPDYLKCVICHLVLRDPMLHIECGHRFCNGCFEKLRKHAEDRNIDLLCPHDRVKIKSDQIFADKGISRAVLDLQVKCNNVTVGCLWIGELRHLQNHLDETCGCQEKKDTKRLLAQVMGRLDAYDARLDEKDKQIEKLEKDLKSCENKIKENETTIKYLKDDLKKTQEEVHHLLHEESSNTKKQTNGEASNVIQQHKDSKKRKLNVTEEQFEVKPDLIEELKEKVKIIEKHCMNVKEYLPGEHTLFEWHLKDFSKLKEEGSDVYSPMFYDTLGGHCCKLSVKFVGNGEETLGPYGNEKKTIGLYLHCSRNIYGGVLQTPFAMNGRFAVCDKDGKYHEKFRLKKSFMQDNQNRLIIPYGADVSRGVKTYKILHMRSMNDFLIDDTLSIRFYIDHNI